MQSRNRRLTLAQWALLGLIAERSRHGFALAKLLAPKGEVGVLWSVPVSAVYRSLATLQETGLVDAPVTEPSEAGPQRTLYSISDRGARWLDEWLWEPVAHVREARSGLMLKLLLLERSGRDAGPLLDRQALHFREVLAAIEAAPQAPGVLARWRLEGARSVLRFVETTRAGRF